MDKRAGKRRVYGGDFQGSERDHYVKVRGFSVERFPFLSRESREGFHQALSRAQSIMVSLFDLSLEMHTPRG